jgi:nickel/cobalt transporter (NiCoT) family protein
VTHADRLRLSGFGAAVVLLHLLGWGLFCFYARRYPALGGLGTLAYAFGLRHAFDVDHIAAIGNATRKFLQDGKRPLGVGFFFSLGHSTVLFSLAAALAIGAHTATGASRRFEPTAATSAPGVSGTFLLLIGILNLLVLVDIARVLRDLRAGCYDRERLERRLLERGFLNRLLMGRLGTRIRASWQMYPLGFLFGLGFDTATEVGLLALAAGVATHAIPFLGVISLPLLFAAGMSLMDTVDGAFMSRAYGWAFSNPVRRIFYDLTVTGLSVAVALLIGAIELLQVAVARLGLGGGFWSFVETLDFSRIGYGIVALFVFTWTAAAILWRAARLEQRWSDLLERSSSEVLRASTCLRGMFVAPTRCSSAYSFGGSTSINCAPSASSSRSCGSPMLSGIRAHAVDMRTNQTSPSGRTAELAS